MIFFRTKKKMLKSCNDGLFTRTFNHWCVHKNNQLSGGNKSWTRSFNREYCEICRFRNVYFSNNTSRYDGVLQIKSGTFIWLEDEEEL